MGKGEEQMEGKEVETAKLRSAYISGYTEYSRDRAESREVTGKIVRHMGYTEYASHLRDMGEKIQDFIQDCIVQVGTEMIANNSVCSEIQ